MAGSQRYPGAAVLACRGALAAGVGMVRYLGPPDVADLVRRSCPEVVCGTGSAAETHVQAWLLGPGLDEEAHEQLERVRDAAATGLPVVADAGALPCPAARPRPPVRAHTARRRTGRAAGTTTAQTPAAPESRTPPSPQPGRPVS